MTDTYNPQEIEPRWQATWERDGLYRSRVDWSKPKHYALTMLPYPSGDLHIGHWFAMTPSDARARYMRMKGYNVLFPMGFDAFGLPAENAAIQRNIHPAKWTYANIERMRGQLRSMGAMFDWEREAVSCEPSYYKWTEWFFKKFYEAGLAYRGEAMVNWSPTLQTVLANEQVIDGHDERTGQPVIQKMMTQWFFRYTRYADEMLDFSELDWPEPIKIMQTNWIGRSEGAQVVFKVDDTADEIRVYTTRPDTLWGATFMVLAPEHKLVDKITTPDQREAIDAYRQQAAGSTEIERTAEDRDKTGVFTGAYAINPVNDERIPIWIADYVMVTYGTGAIMAVPYGDQRDFDFARKFGLKIVPVVQPEGVEEVPTADNLTAAYTGAGVMINSGAINGTVHNGGKGRKSPAIAAAIDYLQANGIGQESVNYRLRDWLVSRQRYWGSPIPMIHRADGTLETVPDDQLPVELPRDVEFTPSGRSPLTYYEPFLNATDSAGDPARRETDTMDTFMCSSWYWYRYLSPQYDAAPFDPEEAAYWLPVDVYTGGAEHATMHLLYARWFNKAMRDLGMFDEAAQIMRQNGRDPEGLFDEPMMLLRNQGQVLGAERPGDYILATGRYEGDKLFADHVRVVDGPNDVPAGFEGVFGEIRKRTENVLQVDMTGVRRIVEVVEGATVEIPDIEGKNDVNQLRHHLEIMRMSKSRGNVVNPDELVGQYGADTVRAYLMFAFDWEKGGPWDPNGIKGVVNWLNDVWQIAMTTAPTTSGDPNVNRDVERKVHQAIDSVQSSLERFSFNTAIAALMALRNNLQAFIKGGGIGEAAWRDAMSIMLRLMSPITPHITEELWHRLGFADSAHGSVHQQAWPVYDADKAREDSVTLVVMVNGKPRGEAQVAPDISEEEATQIALTNSDAQRFINGNQPKKIIFIRGRKGQEPKVNIVV
ncbi:MAG: leucine--tRNA ligase [Anaerolineaceae bacterium]|nr:MAG: leucine--tRNA ligase [Anaerolineaceae bacterium]